jgi:hypothetical protein
MERDEFLQRLYELRRREAEHSAQSSRNPHGLLPGEDPASPYSEDAVHWATIYRELITFKESVLREYPEPQDRLSESTEAELRHDEEGLQVELERLRLHLRYWEERRGSA